MNKAVLSVALVVASFLCLAPAHSASKVQPFDEVKQVANPFAIPVLVNGLPSTFTITRFAVQNGQLVGIGSIPNVTQQITAPVTITNSTCSILSLHIGAVHLDLLGLVIDLAPVDLNITAQSAPGNLLGNLLCAITNLLNNPSAQLNGVVGLLNRILGIFG
jgi:hypothetical protein